MSSFNESVKAAADQYAQSRGFLADIAAGHVPGATPIYVSGRNGDVDNAREDVWESGGTYIFPPDGGIQMRVVSTSANDDGNPAGTGARSVDIHYLDADGIPQEEAVTLNGTSGVNTVATNIRRVNDFHVKTAGSGASAAGTISLTDTAGAVTYSSIDVAAGQHYLDISLRATCDFAGQELTPGIFQHKVNFVAQDGTEPITLLVPLVLPPLTDVKISCVSDTASANVIAVAGFNGWHEEN